MLQEQLNIPAAAPYNGAEYDLVTGVSLIQGNIKRLEKSSSSGKAKEAAGFRELMAAGKWLISILEKYRHAANTDLKKMTKQIIALCEKWDK